MALETTSVESTTAAIPESRGSGWQRGETLADVGWFSGLRLRRERLLAAIDSLRVEVASDPRFSKLPELSDALARARDLAIRHRLHSGWSQFNTARRIAVRLDDDELRRARATAIRAEANAAGKLSAWRREAILALLSDPPATAASGADGSAAERRTPSTHQLQAAMQVLAECTSIHTEAEVKDSLVTRAQQVVLAALRDPPATAASGAEGSTAKPRTPSVPQLQAAMQLLDEGLQGIHQRNQLFAQQVFILLAMMFFTTIGFTILVWRSTSLFTEIAETGPLVLGICLMGSLGGSFSALSQLVSSARNQRRVPDQILDGYITILRPALGVTAALVVWLFLRSGILNLGTVSSSVVLACAFVAGFSDSLILRGIQAITGSAAKDEKSESGAKSGTAGKEPKPAG